MPRVGYGGAIRRYALTLFVCLALAATASGARSRKIRQADARTAKSDGAYGRVTDVRFWSRDDSTRIAVEVNKEFEFRTDRLAGPDRLFFDILGTKPAKNPKGVETISVNDKFIRQVRVAQTAPGTTRIVLDLNANVQHTASQLANPDRLIIELRPVDKDSRPAEQLRTAERESRPPEKQQEAPKTTTRVFEPPAEKPRASLPQVPRLEAPKMKVSPPVQSAALERAVKASANSGLPSAIVTDPPKSSDPAKVKPALAKVDTAGSVDRTPTPIAAKRDSIGERSMTRVLGLKLGRVVIDAGHGGHDAGTRGPSGLLEKDLVLDVAKRLGTLIDERLGSEVVFTRYDDTFIPLEERTRIANRRHADLFLSIHANSSPVRAASGVETYYLNFTTNKAALDVAARENASSDRSIYDLRDLVQKITLNDKLGESREFAAKVQSSLSALSTRTSTHSKDRGVRKAPFVVLIGASMPSILAEIGFVSNPQDEAMMKKPEYRQKLAEALYKGLAQYAAGLSQFQVAGQRRVAAGGE